MKWLRVFGDATAGAVWLAVAYLWLGLRWAGRKMRGWL